MCTRYKCICCKHHVESDILDNACSLPNIPRGLGLLTKLTLGKSGQMTQRFSEPCPWKLRLIRASSLKPWEESVESLYGRIKIDFKPMWGWVWHMILLCRCLGKWQFLASDSSSQVWAPYSPDFWSEVWTDFSKCVRCSRVSHNHLLLLYGPYLLSHFLKYC